VRTRKDFFWLWQGCENKKIHEGGVKMQAITAKRVLIVVIAVLSLSVMFGCAGKEFAPKDPYMYWYYPKEMPEADRAVEAARQAGKDRQCPDEFNAAWDLKEKAYATYAACRTQEAIAMAMEATAMANALCPSPPACELTAAPKEIEQGQSATLKLTTSGKVKSAVLEGTEVAATGGTKTVSPTSTTSYTAKVAGPAGSTTCSVTVTVTVPPPPPPPPPAARVIDRLTIHVNFDFDKSNIRKADEAELKKAIDFVRKYPGAKVELEGHTDCKGTEEYNQKLSERRAEATRQYLIKEGAVDKEMISATGYGELRPVAPNKTKEGKDNPEGRAENRRVEVLIISE
jgi:outer membrane protein OmpA-like peptidoglycan-associated protein